MSKNDFRNLVILVKLKKKLTWPDLLDELLRLGSDGVSLSQISRR